MCTEEVLRDMARDFQAATNAHASSSPASSNAHASSSLSVGLMNRDREVDTEREREVDTEREMRTGRDSVDASCDDSLFVSLVVCSNAACAYMYKIVYSTYTLYW